MRYAGIIATAVGAAKPHGHFNMLQFTRASTVTRPFCCRIHEVQFLPSRLGPPRSGTYFHRPLYSRLSAVLLWFGRICDRVFLVFNFFIGVYFLYGLARISTRHSMFYAIFLHL